MTELLWGRTPKPSRGPKPAMTLTGIAETAIRIADAEGLEAVSMQRVAADLSFTKMALYRYVPGKAELVAVMTDLALGEPTDHQGRSWRDALHRWALDLYDTLERHPWLLVSTVGRRPLGPNELTWMDRGVAALADTGLTGGEQLDSVLVVTGHVRTVAQQAITIPGGSSGTSEAQSVEDLGEILQTEADNFPALAVALADPRDSEQGLGFGLDRILDGLQQLIDRRRT